MQGMLNDIMLKLQEQQSKQMQELMTQMSSKIGELNQKIEVLQSERSTNGNDSRSAANHNTDNRKCEQAKVVK